MTSAHSAKVLLLLLCAMSAVFARDAKSTVLSASGKALAEKHMPDFAGIDLSKPGTEVLALEDGVTLAKANPNGRVVLVFFSTSCIPCREGLMELKANADTLQKDAIQVILVAVGDSRENVRNYLTKIGVSFPCVWDKSGQISQNYGVIPQGGDLSAARVPLTAIGDNKGKLLRVITAEGDDYLALIRKGK